MGIGSKRGERREGGSTKKHKHNHNHNHTQGHSSPWAQHTIGEIP